MSGQIKTGILWEQLLSLFPNKREQRLIYLSYSCGLKPREIASLYPQEFCTVQEIHRLRASILNRIQCDADRLPELLEARDSGHQSR